MEIREFRNISFEHPRGSTFKKYRSQDLAPVRFTNPNFNHRVLYLPNSNFLKECWCLFQLLKSPINHISTAPGAHCLIMKVLSGPTWAPKYSWPRAILSMPPSISSILWSMSSKFPYLKTRENIYYRLDLYELLNRTILQIVQRAAAIGISCIQLIFIIPSIFWSFYIINIDIPYYLGSSAPLD